MDQGRCGALSLLKEPRAEGSCGFMALGPGGSRGGLGVESIGHGLSQNREQCLQGSPKPLEKGVLAEVPEGETPKSGCSGWNADMLRSPTGQEPEGL